MNNVKAITLKPQKKKMKADKEAIARSKSSLFLIAKNFAWTMEEAETSLAKRMKVESIKS